MELTAGTVIADRFRLVRLLGQGGMGAVWLAHHQSLDISCAVKFIHAFAAESADIRARFEREAKAAAQLRTPHVVQVLDHGVWQGLPYIAMEYLEGEDLAHRLQARGRLTPREALAIAAQVGRALAKAHGAGLVHRDLKPANIFLVRDDDREIAKVLDFGVAKSTLGSGGTDGNTKTGALMGTPYYMSPEQARGNKAVDHRSDLWALAVVVYQCLTGHLPFFSDALGDLLVAIITAPIPVPSQVASVPVGFDAWWAKAADRDPNQRFQSAKDLVDALTVAIGSDLGMTGSGGGVPYVGGATPWPTPMAAPNTASGALHRSGTVLMAQSGSGSGATPNPMLQATPNPALQAQTPAPHATPYPPQQAPKRYPEAPDAALFAAPAPTPLQQAVPVAAGKPSSKLGVVLIGGAVLIGIGGGAFFALRGGAKPASPPATSADPPAQSAPVASAAPPPAPAPSATAPASATATAEPSAVPTASASAPVPAGPKPLPGPLPGKKGPGPGGKSKTDFGI